MSQTPQWFQQELKDHVAGQDLALRSWGHVPLGPFPVIPASPLTPFSMVKGKQRCVLALVLTLAV